MNSGLLLALGDPEFLLVFSLLIVLIIGLVLWLLWRRRGKRLESPAAKWEEALPAAEGPYGPGEPPLPPDEGGEPPGHPPL